MTLRSIDGMPCNEDGNPLCKVCGDERTEAYNIGEFNTIWLCDTCFDERLNEDLWNAYIEEIEPTIEDYEERLNGL